jgi:predicted ABC-type ATPase
MEKEKQLTAVEWFAERIQSDKIFNFETVLSKAKQMEKQRLKDAYAMGREGKTITEFNETFKSE